MIRKRELSKFAKLFWQIIISIFGILLILMAVVNLSLFLFGASTTAKVTTSRFGGSDDNQSANSRYRWSVDYTFLDQEEVLHSGHTERRGSDMSVNVEHTVYYFRFAPFFNALEGEVKPNLGQPLYLGIGLFLLFIMNKKKKKPRENTKQGL